MPINRILFFTDSHYGKERQQGILRDVHDPKAHSILLQIARDWKPTHLVNGGDGLDAGCVSHHNASKARLTEGMRIEKDATAYRQEVLKHLEALSSAKVKHYLLGNHERFLDDLVDQIPALEGTVSVDKLLRLTEENWTVHPLGSVITIGGKLHMLHGDTIKGGQWPSKWATEAYGRSIMFGHFHTSQRWTKHNALDATDIHRGFAVGCLSRRDPGYGRGAPNRWSQSIALIEEDSKSGQFQVTEIEIVEGKAIYNGKLYRG